MSCVLNSMLLGGAFWAKSVGAPSVTLAVIFVAVTVAEMAVWRWSSEPDRGGRAEEKRALRIETMRRTEARRKNAIIDETTGLYTRWYFDRRIKEEAARCKRYQHSMAVVVLRVDVVKITTFSTDGWQQRSQDAARLAANVVREVDISAALSPFEFAICLIHCDRTGAYRALERLVEQLQGYNCEAGIAVYPDEGYDASGLVDVATARMMPLAMPSSA